MLIIVKVIRANKVAVWRRWRKRRGRLESDSGDSDYDSVSYGGDSSEFDFFEADNLISDSSTSPFYYYATESSGS